MKSEFPHTPKAVKKTANAVASLYFIRHKYEQDIYWYIVAQREAGQEISTKAGFNGAGMWTKTSADYLLIEYGLQEDWEAIPVLEVTGNIDGSIN